MLFENRYSRIDRALHRLAFHTKPAQAALADVENIPYADRFSRIDVSRPVFVTALPRAGTTVLLNLLSDLPEFGSHTYRDMPFLLCPLIWASYSRRFRRSETPRERAHADGLLVSTDSPEAFEEILWLLFWKKHYKADRIEPWGTLDDDQFHDFLVNHMKKIVALRCPEDAGQRRYVSKNNMNVARAGPLARLLPSATIVVLFREPLQHSASALRQHLRFLEIHRRDKFAKAYMATIGHFDFGANLKPIDFGHWLQRRRHRDATAIGFWLEYWIAAYRQLLAEHDAQRIHLVSYESLGRQPAASLTGLCDVLGIEDRHRFCAQADTLLPAKPHAVALDTISADLIAEASALHEQLLTASTIGSDAGASLRSKNAKR